VRLFVAAYPPTRVRDDFAGLVARLGVGQPRERGRSVRLAPVEQMHVTVAFLGDVADEKVDAARLAVDRAVKGAEPFTIRVAGGGTFGRGRFTILWAGLRPVDHGQTPGGAGSAGLTRLAKAVRRELKAARLPYDPKPLRPHLTVARPGDRVTADELAADLASLGAYEGPEWTVDEIRLMRSHLGPHPTYDVLHTAPLAD
jgi:2'-5' RNA ligase